MKEDSHCTNFQCICSEVCNTCGFYDEDCCNRDKCEMCIREDNCKNNFFKHKE